MKPKKIQYYNKVNGCPVRKAKDVGCICWHTEGTGRYPEAKHSDDPQTKVWRLHDK